MNEEINEKSLNLAVRVGQLTADELKKAIEKLLADLKNGEYPGKSIVERNKSGKKTPELKRGKMTLKQLSKHHDGLSTVELKDPNLRLLYRAMKKHNVDFAAVKDGKGKYTLFFKGKDADSITHAFKQYTQKLVKLNKGQSIGKTLAAAKQAAQALNNQRGKVKNKDRGAQDR